MITLDAGSFGWDFIIRNDDGRSVLVQSDRDYPGTASTFGWSPSNVTGPEFSDGCPSAHAFTDGTIDCPDCGTLASTFILSAREWLAEHIGATTEDPGYFDRDRDALQDAYREHEDATGHVI